MVSPSRSSTSRRRRDDAGKFFVGVLILLGLVASIFLVFSNSLQYTRVGLVAALWAAAIGALAATRYRKEATIDKAKVRDLQTVYELQLEREVTARREYEMGVEARVRHEVGAEAAELAALRAELSVLRQNLQRLFEGELPGQRPALHAEATRVPELPGGQPGAANGNSANADWPRPVFVAGHEAPAFATPDDEPVTAETATVPEETDLAWSEPFAGTVPGEPNAATVWSPPGAGPAQQPRWPWEVKPGAEAAAERTTGDPARGGADAPTDEPGDRPAAAGTGGGAARPGGARAGASAARAEAGGRGAGDENEPRTGKEGDPPTLPPRLSVPRTGTANPPTVRRASGWPTTDEIRPRGSVGSPAGSRKADVPATDEIRPRGSVGSPAGSRSAEVPAGPRDPSTGEQPTVRGTIGTPSSRRRRRADSEDEPAARRLSVAEIMANLQSEQKRGG